MSTCVLFPLQVTNGYPIKSHKWLHFNFAPFSTLSRAPAASGLMPCSNVADVLNWLFHGHLGIWWPVRHSSSLYSLLFNNRWMCRRIPPPVSKRCYHAATFLCTIQSHSQAIMGHCLLIIFMASFSA